MSARVASPCSYKLILLYQIPLYAGYKLWSNFIGPMLGWSRGAGSQATEGGGEKETVSKRQEKLRKRSERGDPRVRSVRK